MATLLVPELIADAPIKIDWVPLDTADAPMAIPVLLLVAEVPILIGPVVIPHPFIFKFSVIGFVKPENVDHAGVEFDTVNTCPLLPIGNTVQMLELKYGTDPSVAIVPLNPLIRFKLRLFISMPTTAPLDAMVLPVVTIILLVSGILGLLFHTNPLPTEFTLR